MEKLAELLRSNVISFFSKLIFEAFILIVFMYGWMQVMDVKFESAQKLEADLAIRTLALENKTAFNNGAVSAEIKNLALQVNNLDARITSLEAYLRKQH